MLRHVHHRHADDGDYDARLEHAALSLSGSGFNNKVWNRMVKLLFVSNSAVVNAIVAVMHVLTMPMHHRSCCVHDGAEDPLDGDERVRRLQERMWRSEWRQRIVEKVRDTHAYCLVKKEQRQSSEIEDDGQCGEIKSVALCVRLLRIIGALAGSVRGSGGGDEESHADIDEVLSLLLQLCTSPIWKIAHSATATLLSVLEERDPGRSDVLLEMVYVGSSVIETTAKWFTGIATSPANASTKTVKKSKKLQAIEHERGQLHNAELQGKAIVLLSTLLRAPVVQRSHHASTMCTTLRLSAQLIPIAWLMGHSCNDTATAAANLMKCIALNSPKSDLLRAMVEQGCAIIFHMLSSTPAFPVDDSTVPSPKPRTRALPRSEILDWMAHEIEKELILGGSVTSVLRSSNVLLQMMMMMRVTST
ncbi:hypothetical protein FI667_g8, partial [Globisporangium splendens]